VLFVFMVFLGLNIFLFCVPLPLVGAWQVGKLEATG